MGSSTHENGHQEIERKYLVRGDISDWRTGLSGKKIVQGYLNREPKLTVRVRIEGERAFLTVKGLSDGAVRAEWETAIPPAAAESIIEQSAIPPVLQKVRYRLVIDPYVFEIDEFGGYLTGLVTAEVEKPAMEVTDDLQGWEPRVKPKWLGEDVTGRLRYLNSRLPPEPYADWPEEWRTRADGTVLDPGPEVGA